MSQKEYSLINDKNKIPSLLFLLCYFGSTLLFAFGGSLLLAIADATFWHKWLNVIKLGSLTILIIIIFRRELMHEIIDFYKNIKKYLATLILILIPTVWVVFASYSIIIRNTSGAISQNQQAINQMMIDSRIQISLCIYALAPIVEEFVFRGIIFGFFKGKNASTKRIVISMLASSVLFGFYHCNGFTAIEIVTNLPLVFVGFMLALMYQKSNNILCPILLHMIYNWL